MKAIVRTYVNQDGSTSFYDRLPTDRVENAEREILRLQAGEQLLYFYDWSLWGNAKIGFSLATKRVIWKCLWEDRVAVSLKTLTHEEVQINGSTLILGEKNVVTGNDDLALSGVSRGATR